MKSETSREKRVYKYFALGLSAKEIGKLTDLSERTVQRIIKEGDFKKRLEPKPIAVRAVELKDKGFTYVEIAKALKCSKTSVYNYLHKSNAESAKGHCGDLKRKPIPK